MQSGIYAAMFNKLEYHHLHIIMAEVIFCQKWYFFSRKICFGKKRKDGKHIEIFLHPELFFF